MTKCLLCGNPNGNVKIEDKEKGKVYKVCPICYLKIRAANAGSIPHTHKNLITVCEILDKKGE